jgi:transposase
MSQRERDGLNWLKQARDHKITQAEAARRMGVTERWVRKLLQRMKREGDRVVVHKLRGRPSNRRLKAEVRQQALELIRSHYSDFGPTLASEYLATRHHLQIIGKESLRQWMMQAQLWKARPATRKQIHVWRPRREAFGELLQWDTSEHAWLEERGPKLYLIAMIDDASSRAWAHFAEHDSMAENMRLLWSYLERFGRPLEFYTDKASLFCGTAPRQHQREPAQPNGTSQIRRALQQLGIGWIAAHSPQAKGRIERFFGTAQDRLVKGLRLAGASTLAQANHYLEQAYLPMWASRFSEAPAAQADAHRPLLAEHRLPDILCRIEQRTVDHDLTIRWKGERWLVADSSSVSPLAGDKVDILLRLDGTLGVRFRSQTFALQACTELPALITPSTPASRKRRKRPARSQWMKRFQLQDSLPLGELYRRGYLNQI